MIVSIMYYQKKSKSPLSSNSFNTYPLFFVLGCYPHRCNLCCNNIKIIIRQEQGVEWLIFNFTLDYYFCKKTRTSNKYSFSGIISLVEYYRPSPTSLLMRDYSYNIRNQALVWRCLKDVIYKVQVLDWYVVSRNIHNPMPSYDNQGKLNLEILRWPYIHIKCLALFKYGFFSKVSCGRLLCGHWQ